MLADIVFVELQGVGCADKRGVDGVKGSGSRRRCWKEVYARRRGGDGPQKT